MIDPTTTTETTNVSYAELKEDDDESYETTTRISKTDGKEDVVEQGTTSKKTCLERLESSASSMLTFLAVITSSSLSPTLPLEGSIGAFVLNGTSLILDGIRKRRGKTKHFPKTIDCSLCILWAIFVALFSSVSPKKITAFRPYAAVIVNGTLAVVSLLSVLIGRPWIKEHAVDLVNDTTARHEQFHRVCVGLTLYWTALFSILAGLCAIVAGIDTTTDSDGDLRHPNRGLFLAVGIALPFLVVFWGVWSTPRLATRLVVKRGT